MNTINLSENEKKFLLSLARQVIVFKTNNQDFHQKEFFSPTLKQTAGVFVTLNKNNELRGCIGYVEGIKPIQNAIEEMAISAAFDDPRFPPVNKSEIEDLEIEISVLSPLQQVTKADDIKIGRDGLLIEKGLQRGLLLPQVAVEYHWDSITFLEMTCQKAGIPSNSWQDKSTIIKIFSAEIFSDKEV
jgi:AmmeMemoRadiSam system protein A